MDYTSQEIPSFYELYEFTYAGTTYRYVANKRDVTYDGYTYSAADIKREEAEKDQDLTQTTLKIHTVLSDLLKEFIRVSPPDPITVTIKRLQSTNVDILFIGAVISVALSQGNRCIVTLNELQPLFNNKIPPCMFQSLCNHTLFDANCSLTRNDYATVIEVESISGNFIVSTDVETPVDGYYSFGVAEFNGQIRMITCHEGGHLYTHYPFVDLEVGDDITVYPGCDKTQTDCVDKFDNKEHFLGFPYIPRKNPVYVGL